MPTKEWRDCHKNELRAYRRKWYASNKKHAINKVMTRKHATRVWLNKLKEDRGCALCGENDAICLDFHHRADKQFHLSRAPALGWSRARILVEVAKCDVLCANCHRKLHRPILPS